MSVYRDHDAVFIMIQDSTEVPQELSGEGLADILSRYPGATVSVRAYDGCAALVLQKVAGMGEDSDTPQIKLPTDEQVERAARMLCVSRGENQEPQEKLGGSVEYAGWRLYEDDAYNFCLMLLNKDRILGYGRL